jgi:hypothetical protein
MIFLYAPPPSADDDDDGRKEEGRNLDQYTYSLYININI